MRFSFIFLLLVSLQPLVTPRATVTVFQLVSKVTEIVKTLTKISSSINDDADLLDTEYTKKEKLVFSELDSINLQIADIDQQLEDMGDNIIVEMLKNLPETLRLQLKLHNIRTSQFFLDVYYSNTTKYVRDFDEYENTTLLDFADEIVSPSPNSVSSLMKFVYQQVASLDFLQLFSKYLTASFNSDHIYPELVNLFSTWYGQTGYFCLTQKSLAEVFHNFLNEIIVLNTKSYIMTQTAYMIKMKYGTGDFKKEIEDSNEKFKNQKNNLIKSIKPYMGNVSTELRRCEPKKHIEGETFHQITNFLHGYIINKANIDPNGRCREECNAYTYSRSHTCNNAWSQKEPTCPKVVNCQYLDSSIKVCLKDMHSDNRRYEYIELGNGEFYGKSNSCPNENVAHFATYTSWLIWKCSYCLCLCDEEPKYFSDRYINLRPTLANTTENRVVTGVRFIKHNQIIHLQIQEGKLLPFGQIDVDSVRWVPPEKYSVIDKYIHDGRDYHTITWEERRFDLVDIKARDGFVVTGVKFVKDGSELHLEVQTTPFNFTSGQLNTKKSIFKHDPNLKLNRKFRNELKLIEPDIPTLSSSPPTDFTTNKYVQFVNSDLVKDAAQTTVPFFDAQPVASAKPVPLVGIGLFHKGRSGYGGFIAPRIFTYNFAKHLESVFPPDNDRRLREN